MAVADLADILAHADRRTLAAVVTHLAGDPNAVPDLRDRAHIEAKATEVLPPYLNGERTPEPPTDEVLQAAMNLAVGAEVPATYRDYVREQTGIGPVTPLQPLHAPDGYHVLIIGAGVTGVLAARTLDELGLHSYTIVDKNPEPGGTWWVNQYPGCRVDTPSLLYSYTFDQDPGWPEHFSRQPELLKYVKRTAEQANIGDRMRCSTEVAAMRWDGERTQWHVELRSAGGESSTMWADAVIAALGILRVAKYPQIPGLESFAGPAMHSTAWDKSVDLTGKRVGLIGTGASANQILPSIAPIAGEVVVYQRTGHWMMSHPKYGKALEGIERRMFEAIPTYREWNRFSEGWKFGDGVTDAVKIDPSWHSEDGRSISEANDKLRAVLTEYILSQVEDRPDLADKVMPNFPPYAKRLLVDNGWFQALKRDNVRLETAPIKEITPDGITTAAGHDQLDVLALATGFKADTVLWPMQVTGVGGVDVTQRLEDNPEAYLGISVADCPNLFVTPGPNGVLGHAGSGVLFAECHVRYIMECLRATFDSGKRTMTIKPEALRAYTEEICAELPSFVQSIESVDNWYRGGRDRVTTIAPKTVLQFWTDTRRPKLEAYDFA
ncbi:MAG: flavin-containing monooxygenase [Acidimicrobiales bacterium]